MQNNSRKKYNGPVKAVVFDWAGTVIDFGSLAPLNAFRLLFERQGVEISVEEARQPMGAEKRDHIQQLLSMPRIAEDWIRVTGKRVNQSTVDALYSEFIPVQIEAIASRCRLIPGVVETCQFLQGRGIAIGANTGYGRDMIADMVEAAARQGYQPQSTVCATDVPRGRPYPHMLWQNLLALGIEAVQSVVKVDDTVPGIQEGLNAGCWTVAVTVTGNEVGLDLEQWDALSSTGQQARRQKAVDKFATSGAHYIIDSVADLPAVIDDIEQRLKAGDRP